MKGYLGLQGAEDAAVMLGEDYADTNAMVRSGVVYWDEDDIVANFADNFWVNLDEGVLLVTTADEVVRADSGELYYTRHAEAAPGKGVKPEQIQTDMPVFFVERGRGYISLDFAKQFSNFTYTLFTDPYRVQIYTKDATYDGADILKKTQLRAADDIKSDVVSQLHAGDSVYILSRGDDWAKVRTKDALTGYVESRRLPKDSYDADVKAPQDYTPPPYTALTEDKKICIAWHQVTVADANAYLGDRVASAWPLDVISPTWYSIADKSGTVKSLAWQSYVQDAHARGLKVWPLVDDFTDGLDRAGFLASTDSRNAFVSYMVDQAVSLGFDGINLDFEVVPADSASGFSQLLRELSVACRAHGLVFSIDNYPPRPSTEHYNRALQGQIADYVIIMGYDEHWGSSSGVGSVASLPFVKDAIEKTLAVVPANKTINAVPFYTRIWSTARDGTISATAVGQSAQADWLAKRGLEPIWSDELGQHYTQTDENDKLYQIWLEDGASMQARIDLMAGYDLGGVACWRLGLEDPSIWDILGKYRRG